VHRGSATETRTIDAEDLLVGDLIKFEQGMKVPADCVMASGQDLCTDESELTGEPDEIEKAIVSRENYATGGVVGTMLAKSLVTSGVGTALVVAVGPQSQAGVIT